VTYIVWPIEQKFHAELKKEYFMGSEMQPEVIKTWNSNKSCNKNLIFNVKKFTFNSFYYGTGSLFYNNSAKFYSKILKNVISFMNRKSAYEYVTHFFHLVWARSTFWWSLQKNNYYKNQNYHSVKGLKLSNTCMCIHTTFVSRSALLPFLIQKQF
jgi:hypothetical protein